MAPSKGTRPCSLFADLHIEHDAVRNHADGRPIGSLEDMKEAAVALHALGPQWVLVKVTADKTLLFSPVISE